MTTRYDFQGKHVLISGASKGIGQGIAQAFAAAGASLVLVARDVEALQQLAATLSVPTKVYIADLADIREVTQLATTLKDQPIDILINNAGVSHPEKALDASLEHWEHTFAVNTRAAFVLAQAAAPYMMAKGWGRVVNISSQAALIALPDHVAYCASKGALEMISKVLALEWAPYGITVNCICPTVINTPMAAMAFPTPEAKATMLSQIPVGRFGEVVEVAHSTLFLASEEAAMITGDSLKIDGGWTAR